MKMEIHSRAETWSALVPPRISTFPARLIQSCTDPNVVTTFHESTDVNNFMASILAEPVGQPPSNRNQSWERNRLEYDSLICFQIERFFHWEKETRFDFDLSSSNTAICSAANLGE